MPDLLETRYSPACVTVPNFVAVGQKVGLQVGEPHFFFWGGDAGVTPWDKLVPYLCNHTKFWLQVGEPKICWGRWVSPLGHASTIPNLAAGRETQHFGDAGVSPLGHTRAVPVYPYQISSLWVKPFGRNMEVLQKMLTPLCPTFQGHLRSL